MEEGPGNKIDLREVLQVLVAAAIVFLILYFWSVVSAK